MLLKSSLFLVLIFPHIIGAENLSNSIWFVSKSIDDFTEERYVSAIGFNAEEESGVMMVCNTDQGSLSGAIFNVVRTRPKGIGSKRAFVRTKIDDFPVSQSYWESYVSRYTHVSRVNPDHLSTLIEQIKVGNLLSVQVVLDNNETLMLHLSLKGSNKSIKNALNECYKSGDITHSIIPHTIAYNYFYDVLKGIDEEGRKASIEREKENNNKALLIVMETIKSRIERRWRIPVFSEPGTENTVSVRFNYDGTVRHAQVVLPSGDKMFDQSTLIAAKSLSGVPNFRNISIPFFKVVFQPLELKFKKPLVSN
ncbi:energy transducer TonB family protein [Marinomonas dokdonensis]|uniref:energy transducer TonB family protein n=1 Tax=Marinomonas dokdonensis TaxID=328224 RepID=UPI0040556C4B